MVQHEFSCFKERSGRDLDVVFAIERCLEPHLLEGRPAVFFGGSGAYSVTDEHDWIREALDFFLKVVDQKVPAYASCFAFQGLALAMGERFLMIRPFRRWGSFRLTSPLLLARILCLATFLLASMFAVATTIMFLDCQRESPLSLLASW